MTAEGGGLARDSGPVTTGFQPAPGSLLAETRAVDEEFALPRSEEWERPGRTEEIPTIGEVLVELLAQYCVKFPRCRVTIVEEGPPVCAAP